MRGEELRSRLALDGRRTANHTPFPVVGLDEPGSPAARMRARPGAVARSAVGDAWISKVALERTVRATRARPTNAESTDADGAALASVLATARTPGAIAGAVL